MLQSNTPIGPPIVLATDDNPSVDSGYAVSPRTPDVKDGSFIAQIPEQDAIETPGKLQDMATEITDLSRMY